MPEDELRAAARDGSNVDAGRGSDRELGDGDVRWRRTCRGAAKDAGTWRSGGLPRRMKEEEARMGRRRSPTSGPVGDKQAIAMATRWSGGPLSLAGSVHGERRCRGGVEEGAGGDLCYGVKAEIERVTLAPLWHTSRGRRRGMREIERKVGSEREKRI